MSLLLRQLSLIDYLKNTASSESSSVCPMRIEKPKDEDIRMKESNMKRNLCVIPSRIRLDFST